MDGERLFAQLAQMPLQRRWRRQQGPVLGVITLIERVQARGEICYLLIRRRYPPYAGKWALVGGKVDFGETLAMAAVREVAEETGLRVTFAGLRGIVNERLAPAGPSDLAGHFLLFICAVLAPEGQPQEQEEGAVAWFGEAEIEILHEKQAVIPSDYAMLHQFSRNATNLPYYEAEMIAANSAPGATVSPHLHRFECMLPS